MDELTLSHELTVFRDFRGDTPGPSAAETETARERLLDAMAVHDSAAPRLGRRWTWLGRFTRPRFWAPVAAAAAVTALAIIVALLAAPGPARPTPHPSPAATHRPQLKNGHSERGTYQPGAGQASAGQSGRKPAARTGAAGSPAIGSGLPGSPATNSGPATPTTTSLAASPAAGLLGQGLLLTATVSDQAGDNVAPWGTISFSYAYTASTGVSPGTFAGICAHAEMGYNQTTHADVATCYYTPTIAGTYYFLSRFAAVDPYSGSDSSLTTVNVANRTATETSLAVTTSGQTATMTATVTSQAGADLSDGTVNFFGAASSSTELIYACTSASVSYDAAAQVNVATCSYTLPAAGSYLLYAEFNGNQTYLPSVSTEVTATVGG